MCHLRESILSALLALLVVLLVQPLKTNASPLNNAEAYLMYSKGATPNEQGDYSFEFQTSNGITTKAAGNAYGSSGAIQYISKEGIPITMTYVADANGYHPVGEHIPKMPDYILRSLEYIRRHRNVVDQK